MSKKKEGGWSDEWEISRYPYLIEYKGRSPDPPRIFSVIEINYGFLIDFSEPLFDGGSRIIECRASGIPVKL